MAASWLGARRREGWGVGEGVGHGGKIGASASAVILAGRPAKQSGGGARREGAHGAARSMSLPVSDWRRSRDWWRDVLGFKVEFEIPERSTVAMVDEADLTVFLENGEVIDNPVLGFTVQVDDVEASRQARRARRHLRPSADEGVLGLWRGADDPDGYHLLWDEVSMREKGGG